MKHKVGIIMGSDSDLNVMDDAVKICKEFQIDFKVNIVSAHRTPDWLYKYATEAKATGIHVIIAGAGGAAHLPGMVASLCSVPVIGVPIRSSNSIDGWDSILSILQMPNGIPVATVALNAAKNAALLAIQILAVHDPKLFQEMENYKEHLANIVLEKNQRIQSNFTK